MRWRPRTRRGRRRDAARPPPGAGAGVASAGCAREGAGSRTGDRVVCGDRAGAVCGLRGGSGSRAGGGGSASGRGRGRPGRAGCCRPRSGGGRRGLPVRQGGGCGAGSGGGAVHRPGGDCRCDGPSQAWAVRAAGQVPGGSGDRGARSGPRRARCPWRTWFLRRARHFRRTRFLRRARCLWTTWFLWRTWCHQRAEFLLRASWTAPWSRTARQDLTPPRCLPRLPRASCPPGAARASCPHCPGRVGRTGGVP